MKTKRMFLFVAVLCLCWGSQEAFGQRFIGPEGFVSINDSVYFVDTQASWDEIFSVQILGPGINHWQQLFNYSCLAKDLPLVVGLEYRWCANNAHESVSVSKEIFFTLTSKTSKIPVFGQDTLDIEGGDYYLVNNIEGEVLIMADFIKVRNLPGNNYKIFGGILLKGVSNCVIKGLEFIDCGIRIEGRSQFNSIKCNIFKGGGISLGTMPSKNNIIGNKFLSPFPDVAISLYIASDNLISDNVGKAEHVGILVNWPTSPNNSGINNHIEGGDANSRGCSRNGNSIENFADSFSSVTCNSNKSVELEYKLSQNHPNPFNPETTISYSVEKNGQVKLAIYNVLGQKVADLVNEFKVANSYKVNFDASNLTSGIYFYRMEVGDYSKTMKMILQR